MIESDQASPAQESSTGVEIAIVGMAGRFPGAASVDALWRNIVDGVESLVDFDDDTLRARGVADATLADPAYVKAGMVLEGVDRFDAGFFGYSPREAERLDPQQRVFLETAWHALEHAGYAGAGRPALTGVYAGSGANLYLMRHLLPGVDWAASDIASLLGLMTGNDQGSLATRVAYKLDLRGPAVSVQTACSTSLVAVHMACRALLNYESDLALAGGVSLNLLQETGYRHQAGAILSPDGHCRAFDAAAGGTVIGSGAGVVVLKRLDDALRDGDTIHAMIKGSALNNDGAGKMAYSAPSVDGQADVIEAALAMAGVDARTIGYVEAHGTGTALGDPVEIAALAQAFRAGSGSSGSNGSNGSGSDNGSKGEESGYCAIGSIKTNIGHLDAAAGVAGLIKAVLALRHRTLPPSLHYTQPNPQIDFASSPFYVNSRARTWFAAGAPRRAGVSSFGMGGTNAHVVLEEAPMPLPPTPVSRPAAGMPQPLLLSARSAASLAQAATELAAHLARQPGSSQPQQDLADVAHTLYTGRRHFAHRLVVLATDPAQAAALLEEAGAGAGEGAALVRGQAMATAPAIAFLFPGQGAQHVDMGRALYESDPIVRATVDRCCALLERPLGLDLRTVMYPAPGDAAQAADRLDQTALTQPALFVLEYALAQMWLQRGVRPDALLGHSIGEYVAACLAGVFTLDDALAIVAERGRLLQAGAEGAMLAVGLPETALDFALAAGCDLAAVNAADLCVLAGPVAAVRAVELRLQQGTGATDANDAGVAAAVRRLHVNRAFHSALVEPAMEKFEALLRTVRLQPPAIPFVSNLSGDWITDAEACDPAYWVRHMRGTVRFADGLATLLAKPERLLLEVGPGDTLATLARRHPLAAGHPVLATQAHPARQARGNHQHVLCAARLWTAGVALDAAALGIGGGRRVPLPGYAFERQSYWVAAHAGRNTPAPASDPGVAKRDDSDGWLLRPLWKQALPLPLQPAATSANLVLMLRDQGSLPLALAGMLSAQGRRVVEVERGAGFERVGADCYAVRPDSIDDLRQLVQALAPAPGATLDVCHLWSLRAQQDKDKDKEADAGYREGGIYSLLALAQAIDGAAGNLRAAITVVTEGLADVTGAEVLQPWQALLVGPCKVIPQEYPHIACRLVDIVPVPGGGAQERQLAASIARELAAPDGAPLVACRGPHRWREDYEPLPLPLKPQLPDSGPGRSASRLRRQGVYLITGGFGGVGLALASHLARDWQATLVLVGRTALADDAPALRALRALGATVLALAADVADAEQMAGVVGTTRGHFGTIHGVIHAAGVAGGGLIAGRSQAATERVLAPKTGGAPVLLAALAAHGGDQPDFVLLCSSLTAVTGGYAQADYCSANAFLDALARRTGGGGGLPWVVSVNWDVWRDTGMAAGQRLPDEEGIDAGQAGTLLERILSGPQLPQVVVSTIGLARQIARAASMETALAMADRLAPAAIAGRRRHARPAMSQAFVAPAGPLETGLADLWSDFLGIAPVGATDDLFELGADSLLAIQLLAKVRGAYGVELHPAGFFKNPTIAALAVMVETRIIEDIASAEAAG